MKGNAIKYGTLMGGALILFFLVMHYLGYSMESHLRWLNGLIHISCIYLAIRSYANRRKEKHLNYLIGLGQGIWTSICGILLFSIFMMLFLTFHPAFMSQLQANIPQGQYLTPITAGIALMVEGISVSFLASYIVIRVVEMEGIRPEFV